MSNGEVCEWEADARLLAKNGYRAFVSSTQRLYDAATHSPGRRLDYRILAHIA